MADKDDDWLSKLYIRDTIGFLQNTFSKMFPRVNEKLSEKGGASKMEIRVLGKQTPPSSPLSNITDNRYLGFMKSFFSLMGASVFLVSTPLICAHLWRLFRSSRPFDKLDSEISNCGIVITGCDSGIGVETAAIISAAFPDVLVFAGCLTAGGVQKLNSLQRSNLISMKADVTSDTDVCDFVNVVRSRLADRKLYAIINNAGAFDGSFVEVTPIDVYTRVMQVNFFGVIRVTKAFLPLLMHGDAEKYNGGRIINISSVAELLCSPGNTAYCASKSAMAAFTDGLRQELIELGIQVIRIVPGPVRTGSLSQIPVSAARLLSHGPSDVMQRFGGRMFLTAYERFFSDLYDSASPPVRIAKVIQRVLIRKYPRDIYYEDDPIYNILSLCPHFVRDFLMDLRSFRKQIMTKYAKT